MASKIDTLDLARLALSSGQGKRIDAVVVPGALELGGNRLEGGPTPARIDVSRTAAGHAMRLRLTGELRGDCVRCLEPARVEVEVDAREVDQASADDEDLVSPYVSEGALDLRRWAHDALALALPQQLVCRPDCAGLCAVCGESLNDGPEGAHDHAREPDPRWAKLRELQ